MRSEGLEEASCGVASVIQRWFEYPGPVPLLEVDVCKHTFFSWSYVLGIEGCDVFHLYVKGLLIHAFLPSYMHHIRIVFIAICIDIALFPTI
jgi:hypothetical protein